MAREWEAITNKMAELTAKRQRILALTDITGGEKGLRENDCIYKRAERLQGEIARLNKKLFHLAGLNPNKQNR